MYSLLFYYIKLKATLVFHVVHKRFCLQISVYIKLYLRHHNKVVVVDFVVDAIFSPSTKNININTLRNW